MITAGQAAKMVSRQWYKGCNYVFIVIYIFVAKFTEQCFIISRGILDSVFYNYNNFSGTNFDVITSRES